MDKKKLRKGLIEWICRIFIVLSLSIALAATYSDEINLAKELLWNICSIGGMLLIVVITARHIKRQGGIGTDIVIATFIILLALRLAIVLSEIFYSTIDNLQELMAVENATTIFIGALFVVMLFVLGADNIYQRHQRRQGAGE